MIIRCMLPASRIGALLLTVGLAGAQSFTASAQQPAPADVKALIDGTFELVEWHEKGRILRPPEIGGLWSSYDGIVFVTFHRVSDGQFMSLTSYGTYETTATSWKYQYQRTTTASGETPEKATVRVTTGLKPQEYTLTRKGDMIQLRGNDYREYDAKEFRYMPKEGVVLRVYRRVAKK
jgi:hypothetical protein